MSILSKCKNLSKELTETLDTFYQGKLGQLIDDNFKKTYSFLCDEISDGIVEEYALFALIKLNQFFQSIKRNDLAKQISEIYKKLLFVIVIASFKNLLETIQNYLAEAKNSSTLNISHAILKINNQFDMLKKLGIEPSINSGLLRKITEAVLNLDVFKELEKPNNKLATRALKVDLAMHLLNLKALPEFPQLHKKIKGEQFDTHSPRNVQSSPRQPQKMLAERQTESKCSIDNQKSDPSFFRPARHSSNNNKVSRYVASCFEKASGFNNENVFPVVVDKPKSSEFAKF